MPDQPVPTAIGLSVQQGVAELGLTIDKSIQPVWGKLTKQCTCGDALHYEWKQVVKPEDGKWRELVSFPFVAGAYGSTVKPEDAGIPELLLDPAVEANSYNVVIGAIVRLFPSQLVIDEYGNVHRFWLFTRNNELRPFRLRQDLIPTGPVSNPEAAIALGSPANKPGLGPVLGPIPRETVIQGEWLDVGPLAPPEQHDAVLFPEHKAGFKEDEDAPAAKDAFFSLGIGVADQSILHFELGEFATQGTIGWAKWVEKATALRYDDDNEIIWQGEWQIVTLNAIQIVTVVVDDPDEPLTIQPGTFGRVQLLSVKATPAGVVTGVTGLGLIVYNDLPVPMTVGSVHKIQFNRDFWMWFPITPLSSEHGKSIYANTSVEADPPGSWVLVPMNRSAMTYGEDVALSDSGLRNTGSVTLIGTVSWHVTAHRVQTILPADIDSRLQVALFSSGVQVPGTLGEITSSRRRAPLQGRHAANSDGNSILHRLAPGATLQVKVRKEEPADENDDWETLEDGCNLTFTSKAGVFED